MMLSTQMCLIPAYATHPSNLTRSLEVLKDRMYGVEHVLKRLDCG
jgi:hypothetical protein